MLQHAATHCNPLQHAATHLGAQNALASFTAVNVTVDEVELVKKSA